MGAWEVRGPAQGTARSWRDLDPALEGAVERVRAPPGRGIAWEGAEIWAYRDRARNIVEAFDRNVAERPGQEAYTFHPSGIRMTWGETGARVQRVAASLRHDHGFAKGDRLCLLTLGGPEYVLGYLAAVRLGGIAVPVNLGLTVDGLVAQIEKVGARALVVSQKVWDERLRDVADRLASVAAIFLIGAEAPDGRVLPFDSLEAQDRLAAPAEIDEWDLCAISFTSGTTGAPKGTMAMHINALGCAQNIAHAAKGLGPDDVNICMPPLYHNTAVYTDFLPALTTGGRCVVMESFAPLDAIKLIERERATWAVAAPIMLWMMMNHPEFAQHDCSSLRKILFGGHAASETFIRQLKDSFDPVAMVNGGAVSESTALGFALPTEDAIRKITSCGLATPNTDIAIFDEEGNEVTEPEVIGEVAYRGQQTNAGYWDDSARTAEVFRRDGFVLSGDWAKIDAEGYLWLLDRKKDMVVRGGQNVYCIEVENKLYLHPKVLRAAVVGVPDHVFSERLKAVIVPKPGMQLGADEIRAHCAPLLAPYERPEYVVFTDTMPANPAGKTLKPPLVDAWGETGNSPQARLEAYCASMPEAMMALKMLRLDGAMLTPRAALEAMRAGGAEADALSDAIEADGIAGLLRPSEARFRRAG